MSDLVRMFRKSSSALFGLGLVAVMAVLAVLAPWIAPRDPDVIDTARRLAPILTAGHPLGTDFLGEVPLDLVIRETSDEGRPITVSDPDSPYSQTFRDIAAKVWEKVSGDAPARRAAPRIVVE